jgi:glycosidase
MTYPELVVDPPFWWCGMKNPELLIFVNGPYISSFTPRVISPSVRLVRHLSLDSPHYLAIYVDISQSAPHTFEIAYESADTRFTRPFELRSRIPNPLPATFSSSDVLYLFMPDRFSHGRDTVAPVRPISYPSHIDRRDIDARHGGDIAGVRAHLDYFAELGVTCLWPTPIFENDASGGAYHGYAITNFFSVDPRFGDTTDFFAFVDEAHARGLKVIMDLIFNHCAGTHPWALDPPARDFFHYPASYRQNAYEVGVAFHAYAAAADRANLKDYAFTLEMPDLNQQNPILMQYLVQVSVWWLEAAHLNGIRMDTFPYCDDDALRDWGRAIADEFPGMNIVGEAWAHSIPGCAWWQRGNAGRTCLPTVMDFPLASGMRRFFDSPKGLRDLYSHFGLDFLYTDANAVVRFLENHDMDRFLDVPPKDLHRLRKAWLVLLTVPGIPQLYYGTELLMSGVCRPSDGVVRADFPGGWKSDAVNWFQKEGRSPIQQEAFEFLSRLLHWRQGNDIVAKGSMVMFRPRNGWIAYERRLGEKNVIVVINSDAWAAMDTADLEEVTRGKVEWTDVITGRTIALTGTYSLPPNEIFLLQ